MFHAIPLTGRNHEGQVVGCKPAVHGGKDCAPADTRVAVFQRVPAKGLCLPVTALPGHGCDRLAGCRVRVVEYLRKIRGCSRTELPDRFPVLPGNQQVRRIGLALRPPAQPFKAYGRTVPDVAVGVSQQGHQPRCSIRRTDLTHGKDRSPPHFERSVAVDNGKDRGECPGIPDHSQRPDCPEPYRNRAGLDRGKEREHG